MERVWTWLTENFALEEFECRDGAPVPNRYRANLGVLVENLQVLRDEIRRPITINSGYRTAAWNKAVKGKRQSKHLIAQAADIVVVGYSTKRVAAIIERLIAEGDMSQGGLAVYPSFVHYDVRGNKARW